MSVDRENTKITAACMIGLGLSFYAYTVETAKENDENYVAMCDISEHVKCTTVFMSEYGKGFGIIPSTSIFYAPNPVYGMVFYSLVTILSILNKYATSIAVIILGVLSNICTVYLAYILYILSDICVVCVSTYVVNAIILIVAVKKYRKLCRNGTSKKRKAN